MLLLDVWQVSKYAAVVFRKYRKISYEISVRRLFSRLNESNTKRMIFIKYFFLEFLEQFFITPLDHWFWRLDVTGWCNIICEYGFGKFINLDVNKFAW